MSKILITGASGTVGSALVAELQARGSAFEILRSRPSAGARHADFADRAALTAAFTGIDTLFLLLPLVPQMPEFGRNAIAAAQAAGVRHVVRLSGAGADADSPFAIARIHGEIDRALMACGLEWTLIKPNSFMQNHLSYHLGQIRSGRFHAPHGTGATSLVDVRDIAGAVAHILAEPARHAGRSYTLTGDEALTDAEQMTALGAAAGRTIDYCDIPDSAARDAMLNGGFPPVVVDWLASLNAVVKAGYAAGVSPDVELLTGHPPRRFADFARDNAAQWAA